MAVCPVPNCITLAQTPTPPTSKCFREPRHLHRLHGLREMVPGRLRRDPEVPFATVIKDRAAYETATFSATLPVKKIGG